MDGRGDQAEATRSTPAAADEMNDGDDVVVRGISRDASLFHV
jgi:hypothetical protein